MAFWKKDKPPRGPAYIMSAINNPMLNYREYYMSIWEKVLYFVLAFAAGAAVAFVFYGNLFMEDGIATNATHISNVVVCCTVGMILGFAFLPMRTQQLKEKRKATVRNQFRDLLESLSASLSSGKNVMESFQVAQGDLEMQYSDGSYIVTEVREIVKGLQNNIAVETMLSDFSERAEDEDIKNFSNVFDVCYRRGGNLKDVMRHTYEIISEKMTIADEIRTKLASNKMQLNVMTCMPVGIIAMLRFTNGGFASNFGTPSGVLAVTVGIIVFAVAYLIGQKIVNVKG